MSVGRRASLINDSQSFRAFKGFQTFMKCVEASPLSPLNQPTPRKKQAKLNFSFPTFPTEKK
jgi:hypothetical protein